MTLLHTLLRPLRPVPGKDSGFLVEHVVTYIIGWLLLSAGPRGAENPPPKAVSVADIFRGPAVSVETGPARASQKRPLPAHAPSPSKKLFLPQREAIPFPLPAKMRASCKRKWKKWEKC